METKYNFKNAVLKAVAKPSDSAFAYPVALTDETMKERREKVYSLMEQKGLDCLVIYADLEHGANFEYLTGFLPRFEEALLVLHKNRKAYLLLGNENLKFANYSRIDASAIHVPCFSLPNQPMDSPLNMRELLEQAEIRKGIKIGLVGWKYFTGNLESNRSLFDIPYYIVQNIIDIIENPSDVMNAADLFLCSPYGARVTNNANEIAHYEFGSSLASNCVLQAMDELQTGKTEMEIANYLSRYGQHHNVITICATGERFQNANIYPTDKKVLLGDRISLTSGYKGGLCSRAGYAVYNTDELPASVQDYLSVLAAPYFTAIVAWLENIHIGMRGGELYDFIEAVLPKSKYGWKLNPGHLTSDEEWLSSPIYKNSVETLTSGMLLQTDIIPSVTGYGGVGSEDGIALADEELKLRIQDQYPVLWNKFERRKEYLENVLHIRIHPDVLLLSDTVGYYRPFFLNKDTAFVYEGPKTQG